MKPNPIKPSKGQESVWNYPRPPALEPVRKTLEVFFNGKRVAHTTEGYRVLETSHPPVYYIPLKDVEQQFLVPSDSSTYCEWKGKGSYYSLKVVDKAVKDAAWFYDNPTKRFEPIKNYLAFYAHKMDKCTVDGEEVTPQPGNFYGGWITENVVGPFKGIEGSWGW